MKWIELTKNKAQKQYETFYNSFIKNNDQEEYTIFNIEANYKELREDVMRITENVLNELNSNIKNIGKLAYEFDYRFAIDFYSLLNEKYNFNNYLANNDNIWIYLSVIILPDLVFFRWGDSVDHIYKRSSRIWLKSLWWYIFLAWNDNKDKTIEVLKNNNSDTLVQLVERTGKNGYRVELYKEILYKRTIYGIDRVNTEIFKKMMTINTARIKVVDPYLVNGGITAYVDELYKETLMEE